MRGHQEERVAEKYQEGAVRASQIQLRLHPLCYEVLILTPVGAAALTS